MLYRRMRKWRPLQLLSNHSLAGPQAHHAASPSHPETRCPYAVAGQRLQRCHLPERLRLQRLATQQL